MLQLKKLPIIQQKRIQSYSRIYLNNQVIRNMLILTHSQNESAILPLVLFAKNMCFLFLFKSFFAFMLNFVYRHHFNSHPSPQLACSTTERKEHKIYLQILESNWGFILVPRQCACFGHVGPLIGHIPK